MANNPPVCNVEGVVKLNDQTTQSLSKFQAIPKATDLTSALKAIQAITNNFYTLSKSGNFVEDKNKRTYKTVRVYNPDDTEQWVDVQQITGLTFVDKVTGRTLIWKQ